MLKQQTLCLQGVRKKTNSGKLPDSFYTKFTSYYNNYNIIIIIFFINYYYIIIKNIISYFIKNV
jgi:hypothetical protein